MTKTIRYMILHEVDAELLCDEETLKDEFSNSWEKFMRWFYEEEQGELVYGMQVDKYPPEIRNIVLIGKETE